MNLGVVLALSLVVVSCRRAPAEPDPIPFVPKTATSTTVAAAPSGSSKQLAWDAPKGWTRADKPSAMRRATYTLPKQDGDADAPDLAISVAGGAVDANVDRWVQQFEEDAKPSLKKSTRKIGPYEVTMAELRGTWMGSGMPGGGVPPKHGYAMIAAIVPVDADAKWFFKLVGPQKSVDAARADFETFLNSIRAQ